MSLLVYARNYRYELKWLLGKMIRSVGTNVRLVKCSRGIWKRHCNPLRVRLSDRDEATRSRSDDPVEITDPFPKTDSRTTELTWRLTRGRGSTKCDRNSATISEATSLPHVKLRIRHSVMFFVYIHFLWFILRRWECCERTVTLLIV